jgi:hypothetical protein
MIPDQGQSRWDVARYRQDVPAGSEPSPETIADIRRKLSLVADAVESVEINVERVVAQRIVTDVPLAAMQPTEAVDAWLRQTGAHSKLLKGVRSKFQTVLESSKQ